MARRSYGQYCPVAVALDVVGDRWTMLVLRELLIGDQRFTDLRGALPGIAPNLLAERLRDLQDEGLVEHKQLPPPAARTVYSLTAEGRTVAPVLRALARFGASRLGDPAEAASVRPHMAVHGMLAPFHQPEPPGHRFHACLDVDGQRFDVVTDGARVRVGQDPGSEPDVVVEVTPAELVAARQGRTSLRADDAGAARFARLFGLPASELP